MNDAVVESLERATIEAVAPDQVQTLPGWLLPMDAGTVGRARSAVPLVHPTLPEQQALQASQLTDIAGRYMKQGLRPAFRIPDTAIHLHKPLSSMGMQRTEPTLVMTGTVGGGVSVVAAGGAGASVGAGTIATDGVAGAVVAVVVAGVEATGGVVGLGVRYMQRHQSFPAITGRAQHRLNFLGAFAAAETFEPPVVRIG